MKARYCLPISALLASLFFFCTNVTAQQKLSSDSTLSIPLKDTTNHQLQKDLVFEKSEIEASVDLNLWRKHLQANLLPYLDMAAKNGMKAGRYTVNVRFLIEKNGRISEAVALNDPGFGLGKAAVTVVKTGPIWRAGEQNGKKIRSYHTQPVTFTIQ